MLRQERVSVGTHDDASYKSSGVKSSIARESSVTGGASTSLLDAVSDLDTKNYESTVSSEGSAWDAGLTPQYAIRDYVLPPSANQSSEKRSVQKKPVKPKKNPRPYNAYPNVAPRRVCRNVKAVRSALTNELEDLLCTDPSKRKSDLAAKYPSSLDPSMSFLKERSEDQKIPETATNCLRDESKNDKSQVLDVDEGMEYGLQSVEDVFEENEEWEEARIAASEAAARACDLLEESENVSRYGLNAVPTHRTVLVTEATALALVDAERKRAKYEALTYLNTIEERFSRDKLHSNLKHDDITTSTGERVRGCRGHLSDNDRLVSLFKKLDVLLNDI